MSSRAALLFCLRRMGAALFLAGTGGIFVRYAGSQWCCLTEAAGAALLDAMQGQTSILWRAKS